MNNYTNYLFFFNTLHAIGGAESQALIFIKHLKYELHSNVNVIAFQDGEKIKELLDAIDVSYTVFPFKYTCSKIEKALQYIKLLKLIRKLKPDVLVPYVAESNKIASELFPYSNAKFVFWNQREEGRGIYGTAKEKKLLNQVSAIVSNSTEGKHFLSNRFNIPEPNIHIINNGIVLPEAVEHNNYWHSKLSLTPDTLIISMIANITERKDHPTLLKAWKTIIDNYKGIQPIKLILAGRQKKEILNQLKVLAFDLKLGEHLEFVEFVDDINLLISESYFCVFSSNLEGCPNGVLEAMALEKAVVATQIRGTIQALGEENKHLFLSEPNNPGDFAEKVLNLLQSETLVAELGKRNKHRIRNHFNVTQMVNGYLNLIHSSN